LSYRAVFEAFVRGERKIADRREVVISLSAAPNGHRINAQGKVRFRLISRTSYLTDWGAI